MECVLVHAHDLGSTHLLVGEVKLYHLASHIVVEDKRGDLVVDSRVLDAVCRLGTKDYARVQETFTLPRPVVTETQ